MRILTRRRAREVAAKSDDEVTSEDDAPDDQYTVYECPGLANVGFFIVFIFASFMFYFCFIFVLFVFLLYTDE